MTNRTDVSPIERIASHHWEHLDRNPPRAKSRPADPATDWGVWYTMPGSDDMYRVCEYRKPRAWKRRSAADSFARQSMAPSSPLGKSLGVDRVYVGTVANPQYSRIH